MVAALRRKDFSWMLVVLITSETLMADLPSSLKYPAFSVDYRGKLPACSMESVLFSEENSRLFYTLHS